METKTCISCLTEKTFDQFYLKNGVSQNVCKECRYKTKVKNKNNKPKKERKKERKKVERIKGYKIHRRIRGLDGIYRKICPCCMKIKCVETEYPKIPKIRFCNDCITEKDKKNDEALNFAKDCMKLLDNLVIFLNQYKENNIISDRMIAAVFSDILAGIINRQENPQACLIQFKLMLDDVFVKQFKQ